MENGRSRRGGGAVVAGVVMAVLAVIAGCKEESEPTYVVGGTITGLSGTGLRLSMAGQVAVEVAQGATAFRFATEVADGTAYDVRVALQPTVGTCTVSGGTGTVAGADVSVSVACAGTMGWALAEPMGTARGYGVVFAAFDSGDVLAAGGLKNEVGPDGFFDVTASAERWSAAVPTWMPDAPMPIGVAGQCFVQLPSWEVVVVGGMTYDGTFERPMLDRVQIYDPGTGAWNLVEEHMIHTRWNPACALLDSGLVLILGGEGTGPNTSELFDPASGTFTAVPGTLSRSFLDAILTKLPSGEVLATGGCILGVGICSTPTAELYDPAAGAWNPAGELPSPVIDHNAILLSDGRVLVTGGCTNFLVCTSFGDAVAGEDGETSATIYDRGTNSWTRTNDMNRPRVAHGSLLLSNGDVLVFGGVTSGFPEATEIYHPATEEWSFGPSTHGPRAYADPVQLQDGRWMVGGGFDRPNARTRALNLNTVEIFEE